MEDALPMLMFVRGAQRMDSEEKKGKWGKELKMKRWKRDKRTIPPGESLSMACGVLENWRIGMCEDSCALELTKLARALLVRPVPDIRTYTCTDRPAHRGAWRPAHSEKSRP